MIWRCCGRERGVDDLTSLLDWAIDKNIELLGSGQLYNEFGVWSRRAIAQIWRGACLMKYTEVGTASLLPNKLSFTTQNHGWHAIRQAIQYELQ